MLAEAMVFVGRVRLARGEPKLALPLVERAAAAAEKGDDAANRGEAHFVLGRALWELGADRARPGRSSPAPPPI
jgi:hypothetical protein